MRALLIVGLSCVASVAIAAPKQKVAILGLEVITASGLPDKDTVRVAQEMTVALRTRPKAGTGPWTWTPGSEKDLIDEKLIGNCPDEATACMAVIGSKLGADFLIFGRVEKKSGFYQISLRLLDVVTKKPMTGIVDSIPVADAKDVKLQDFARRLYTKLSGPQGTAAPAPTPPTTPATPPAGATKTSCDASAPITKGDEQFTVGNYGAALVQYEKALACDPSAVMTIAKAMFAACKANNMAKAKVYYFKLPVDKRDRYAQVCIKQSIDPRDF